MTDEQQFNVNRIRNKYGADAPYDPNISADVLWLMQLVEMQHAQIEALSSPEWIKQLLMKFSELTQTRQMLVLDLMREMRGEP